MANAEMILKIVMSSIESVEDFVKQCRMHLPDLKSSEFQKILDMKVKFAHTRKLVYYILNQINNEIDIYYRD